MSGKRINPTRTEGTHLANVVCPSKHSTEFVSKRSKIDHSDRDPVVEKKIDYCNYQVNQPTSISLTPTLDDLMGGQVSSKEFLTSIFRKRAAHITCINSSQDDIHRETRVGALRKEMYDLDVGTLLRETSSESIFLWLRDSRKRSSTQATNDHEAVPSKQMHCPDSLIRSIEVSDVDTALALYKSGGHATYCRAPPKVEQSLVASLLRATGLGCGQYDPSGESSACLGRGEVETFVSTPNHFTNWHFDFQDNYTIQLSGTKKWTLQLGTILDPLRGCTPHYASPEAVESQLKAAYLFDRKFHFGTPSVPTTARGEAQSVLMKPGDVLYFPAGMWHKVETLEPGVSINVSLMATNYATLVSQALSHFLYRDARFREPIANNSVTNATCNLQTLLQELPELARQFSKVNGEGAHDILPPILQHPPSFISTEVGEEDSDEEVEIEGEEVDEEEIHGRDDENGVVDSASENRFDGSMEFKDDLEVLDPANFTSYPSSWQFQLEIGTKIAMYKNPLGALHQMEEITSFYKIHEGKDRANQRPVFVLNINYGGNQMHESAIRIVFRDNEDELVKKLWYNERHNVGQSENTPLHIAEVTERNHYMISFLVYHGYMQVKRV